MKNFKLYVIIDKNAVGKRSVLKVAENVLRGGADIIQLRDKISSDAVLIKEATALRRLTKRHKKIFIINDRVDIALATDADGTHLGQEDMPIKCARKILPGKIIGISTHNLKQALKAERDGADYIGIGPVFRSPSKPKSESLGPHILKKIKQKVNIPFFAIGGIDIKKIKDLKKFDAHRIAVISAVIKSKDVYRRTCLLKRELET
ncbi:MAG: thiamine phosphate synthase [Candidatus Omnitrophica bacterium]|nr:thiamine phosphate synthase [Candidatus Omnitrophota bacterium]MBU4487667.1 thiamine phosphate synthase [Candidatus Omnitrophota bacterium]MCG2705497.1 thiamine phosphate synthase [Candidatus Omnitrophota bacterium]